MERNYFEDKTFTKTDFTLEHLPVADYEGCSFINCNLSGIDLNNIHFIDCVFNGCNMSLVKLHQTLFRDVQFKDCKMLGLQFYDANTGLFSAGFDNCILNHSSFFKINLKKIHISNSALIEVDFTETDLTGAVIKNCDLLNAKFENTILEKADLRTSFNYSINPELNRIKKAKFSMPAVVGLLDKYDIEIE